jgi:hypothetical protein
MTLLNFRKPECYVLEKCVSYSGKYMGFFGNHYHEGHLCYVVGASNKATGEILMRHYNETNNINEEAAKYAATKYWQTLQTGLKKAPVAEETDDFTESVSRWIDEFERQKPKLSQRPN